MTILLCEGFDHYDGVPLLAGKVPFPKGNDNFGWSFTDEDGTKIEVRMDRQPNGSWKMVINDKAELIFNQWPTFLATML
jgi:hypothetical protein